MQPIDWILVFAPLAVVVGFAVYTNRYVKSVAEFLSAGRCAGRYLLANAKGESESGLSSTVSVFEIILVSGFVVSFWDKILYPIGILVAISGFVIYRFRETRALTLAQFFEIRYSRSFRLFMGILAFISGILNYGVFPAISARFLIYFLGLPLSIHVAGMEVSSLALIMAGYLSATVFLVFMGGQATMMITCCLEGLYSQLIYVIIAVAVLWIVGWGHIAQVMSSAPRDHSPINPFDASGVKDYNVWFNVMAMCTRVYSTMAMQQKQGFNSAARTQHESRMGSVLGEWRSYARTLMILLLAICALTFLKSSAFAQQAAGAHAQIASINSDYLQQQLTVPIALRFLLPVGIKGMFLSVMLMGLLSGDGGHLHSWGSIFIQDVILPFRKTAMTPRQHIWTLRCAVIGVATFAFLFSTYFKQTQYIQLWWLLTAAVFVGGAGAAIIGGLYWRKGTTQAAWTAAITGSVLCFGGIMCGHFWSEVLNLLGPALSHLGLHLPSKFWFNDQVSGFIAAMTAALTYVVVSLMTCSTDFNLERMLHRGRYSVGDTPALAPAGSRFSLGNILKFDENFTFGDKLIAGGIFAWTMTLSMINIATATWNLAYARWPLSWWANYWLILALGVPFVIALVTLVWFTIAGLHDMKLFFIALKTQKTDALDDGRVVGHHNLADDEAAFPVRVSPSPKPQRI